MKQATRNQICFLCYAGPNDLSAQSVSALTLYSPLFNSHFSLFTSFPVTP